MKAPANPTSVKKLYLSARELSIRWGKSVHTLKKWRLMGKGPQVFKISGHASYRIEDIEEYERNARTGGANKNNTPE